MTIQDEIEPLIDRIIKGQPTNADIETLRQLLESGDRKLTQQLGKYNVIIGEGKDIHIGDKLYLELNDEMIQAIVDQIVLSLQPSNQVNTPTITVDELVQQVRSRIHADIQKSHGTMPLWSVDEWFELDQLFVDVNILEGLSSSRNSELDDLWEDSSQNPSYRSLDRIGLGKALKRISGLEILKKNKNLMVVGKPGSGKTTYLQRIVTECNAGNIQSHRIPMLIRIREFVDYGRNVDYSLESYLKGYWQLSNDEIKSLLNQGRVIILLDGLDEVTDEYGKTITKEIKKFASAYPHVLVIVTCRTQSYDSRLDRFDYVEVADFNEPQVRLFADHWFNTVAGKQSDMQLQQFLRLFFLEQNKQIRELAITPILLSLTCAVFYETGRFYSKRSNLYRKGLGILLNKWDESRGIERDVFYRNLSSDRKLKLLGDIAAKKFEKNQYVLFNQEELEKNIAGFLTIELEDSQAILKAIASQHGLLIKQSDEVWSFSHLTFQEYFAAKYLVEKVTSSSNFEEIVAELFENGIADYRWDEVLLIMVELLHDPTDNPTSLLEALLNSVCDRVNGLVADCPKCQDILREVDRYISSENIDSPIDEPTAIRAFVFSLILGFDFDLALSPVFNLDLTKIFEVDKLIFNLSTLASEIVSQVEQLRMFGLSEDFIINTSVNFISQRLSEQFVNIFLDLNDQFGFEKLICELRDLANQSNDYDWERIQFLIDRYSRERIIQIIQNLSPNRISIQFVEIFIELFPILNNKKTILELTRNLAQLLQFVRLIVLTDSSQNSTKDASSYGYHVAHDIIFKNHLGNVIDLLIETLLDLAPRLFPTRTDARDSEPYQIDPQLPPKLRELKNLLTDERFDNETSFKEWWNTQNAEKTNLNNGENWTNALKESIGSDGFATFKYNRNEIPKLKRYYDANKLIVECILIANQNLEMRNSLLKPSII